MAKNTFSLLLTCVTVLFIFTACQPEEVVPDLDSQVLLRGSKSGDRGNGGAGNGNGKGNKPGDTGEEEPKIEYGDTYVLQETVDFDPLYKFSFSVEGDLVLLQTDSTITTWGTDYWGSWDEPYTYSDGIVEYTSGLTYTKYEFESIGEGVFDVTKTLIQTIYLSDVTITTITNPGIYVLEE